MTLANCLLRAKHFRELGREDEALAWEARAKSKGWKPLEKVSSKDKEEKKSKA
jgi:hypothetical protein